VKITNAVVCAGLLPVGQFFSNLFAEKLVEEKKKGIGNNTVVSFQINS